MKISYEIQDPAFRCGAIVCGRVMKRLPDGALVHLGAVQGFLPLSQP